MHIQRGAWAEINLDAVAHNVQMAKANLKPTTKLCAVVKADAYGHGAVRVAQEAARNGADFFAVALLQEGVKLREAGIETPILVLGSMLPEVAEICVRYDISHAVFDEERLYALNAAALKLHTKAKIHIKIDTGMHRIGFAPTEENLDEIDKIFELPNIEVTGIFTHFATADEKDKTYTREQFEKFKFMTDGVEARGHKGLIRHCANSGAILDMPELQMDMVRAGIIIYGLYPSTEVSTDVKLVPAMSVKTQVSYVKYLEAGESVGYGRTYFTDKRTKIATIPIGYADGYSRRLSNKGRVIINGEYCNIVGNVCMDQCMVDVTNVPDIKVGDEVVIMGKSGDKEVSCEEIANTVGTINYEIVCNVGKRVPRAFVKNGQVVYTVKAI